MHVRENSGPEEEHGLVKFLTVETRWNSLYEMFKRYSELREYLSKSDFAEDPLLVDTIPSPRENADIVTLSHNLAKFNSIQLALQKEETTLAETRALFDSLINEYPVMAKYISQNSAIVHSKDFESAIVKIQDEKYDCMNFSEKQATVFLKASDDSEVEQIEGKEESFAEAILKKRKLEKVCKSKPILYKDTAFLVPTSNILERFFSAAKFAFNDHRQQLSPVNLEGQLFLKLNSRFWDENTVSSVCENNCN